MRYVIDGFLQIKLIEFKINERERKLLEFMGFISGRSKAINKLINGKNFFWFNSQAFIYEFPYLGLSNIKQIGEYMRKLRSKGIIEIYTDRTPRATYTYIAFCPKYHELFKV